MAASGEGLHGVVDLRVVAGELPRGPKRTPPVRCALRPGGGSVYASRLWATTSDTASNPRAMARK
ncbi:MAG: hypothetical protein WKF73_10005 [Nocardioidaceae bacterium]